VRVFECQMHVAGSSVYEQSHGLEARREAALANRPPVFIERALSCAHLLSLLCFKAGLGDPV